MNKYLYLILIVCHVIIGCDGQKDVSEKSSLESFADSLFQTSVDSAYIAGASVIVYQEGQELLNKSYGFASIELSVPMPENPSFEIGSVTKQFTAAAILKLADQGKLALDDDFTKYLAFDTKGRTITIGHLLNHTSGIDSYTEIPDFWNLSLHQFDRDSLVRLVEQRNFLFEPGEALIYNNSAYFFLGLIIEKASGMSYEEYLQEQFFAPLGMNNTYYCSTSKVVPNKVYGYNYSPSGLQQKPYLDHTWPYAAGSLCSTTEDLLIWTQAIHGGDVLNETGYNNLITPKSLNDGTPLRYAMGLVNYSNFGNREISHGGGIHGFLSQTTYFPESDLYLICLVNTTGPKGAGFFVDELTWQLIDKNEQESLDVDIDLANMAGDYSGQGRGRMLSVSVSETSDGISLLYEGQSEAKSLTNYIGNATWRDGNNIINFTKDALSVDDISGHYVLRKK